MVNRRAIFGGLLSGLVGGTALSASADTTSGDTCDVGPVVSAVDRLREEARRQQRVFWELEPIRQHQRTFLRTFNKYPDFIEVGTDIWHDIYDWHIRYNQAMTLGRDSQGRMTIMVMATTVVMRSDLGFNYIGLPYDKQ